ncbi:IQ-domain [Ancistrocladus abbreviatus]
MQSLIMQEIDRGTEKNIKTVEMDFGETNGSQKSRNSYSNHQHSEPMESQPRFSTHHAPQRAYPKQHYQQVSPAPSAITDLSPRTCSGGHFEDYTFNTTQSSPQYYSAASKPDPSTIPYSFPWPDYAELMSYDYPTLPKLHGQHRIIKGKSTITECAKATPRFI